MSEIHWTGSDRRLIEASEVEAIAKEVAMEIQAGQYDGYCCLNQQLALKIAWYLCSYTRVLHWTVYTDTGLNADEEPEYRIWVRPALL